MIKRLSTNRSLPLLARVASLYLLMALFVNFVNLSFQKPVLAQVAPKQLSSVIISTPAESNIIQGVPIRLQIKRLNIDLEVLFGDYDIDNESWIVNDSNLFFMIGTAEPNTKSGQTVIYGHNTQKILGKTINLKVDDQALVTLDSGQVLTYRFDNQKLINPSDGSFLDQNDDQPRLILFTCHGLFNEQRRLMYFELIDSETI